MIFARLICGCLLAAAAASGPADPGLVTKTSGHFRMVFLPESERAAMALVPELERELARVSASLSAKDGGEITVVYAPDQASFRAWQAGVPEWASGTAYPARSLIYLRPLTGAEVRASSMRAVIAHELTHVVLYRRLGGHEPPDWLNEGMAVYWSLEPLYARVERLYPIGLTGNSIPLRDLENGFPQDAVSASTAYAESGDFVRFLYSQYGQGTVDRYLDLLAAGDDPDDALKAAFPGTLFDLEMKWLHSVRWTYGLIPAISGGALLWFLIATLAIVAYLRRRSRNRLRLAAMGIEERLFYGDEADEDGEEDDDEDEEVFRGLH